MIAFNILGNETRKIYTDLIIFELNTVDFENEAQYISKI